jgi:hypothetical protein
MATSQNDIIVSQVETEKDIIEANLCVSEAFGRQTKDAVRSSLVKSLCYPSKSLSLQCSTGLFEAT